MESLKGPETYALGGHLLPLQHPMQDRNYQPPRSRGATDNWENSSMGEAYPIL